LHCDINLIENKIFSRTQKKHIRYGKTYYKGFEGQVMCAAKKTETEQQRREQQRIDALLCPMRYMTDVFGGKWKLPIICMLSSGAPLRYSTLKRKLGDITNVMLSQSLKELEASGVVHREQYNEVPPRVEYSLTDKGKTTLPILQQALTWATENIQQETVCLPNCERCSMTA
jgi:DNA-binding HxlR family transcriptional regulator